MDASSDIYIREKKRLVVYGCIVFRKPAVIQRTHERVYLPSLRPHIRGVRAFLASESTFSCELSVRAVSVGKRIMAFNDSGIHLADSLARSPISVVTRALRFPVVARRPHVGHVRRDRPLGNIYR